MISIKKLLMVWQCSFFLPIFLMVTVKAAARSQFSTAFEKREVDFESPQSSDKSQGVITRHGTLVLYPDAQATILICHGFMCDGHDVGFLRGFFLPEGRFNFLTFDFRAHGDCAQGQCCTFGCNEAFDVIAAAEYLKTVPECQNKPLLVYGFSMGSVAAIEAQARKPVFNAMILDCPFDSTENVLKKSVDCLKFSLFGYEFAMPGRSLLHEYIYHPYVQAFVKVLLKTVAHMDHKNIQTYMYPVNPAESVKKITIPCFFIHCKNDEKIPISAVDAVFEGAAGPKELWKTNGRRHYDSLFYNPELYKQKLQNFLDRVLSGDINNLPKQGCIVVDPDDGAVPMEAKSNSELPNAALR